MDTDVTLTFYRLSKVSQPDGLKYLKFKGDDGREYITDGNIDSNQGLRLAVKEK